jgi:hypothetical protein
MIGAGFANMNQFDPDAGAFINASGIGGIQAVAINNLVNELKTAGLWNTFNAIYPFVGGTAFSCKWNLINPQDTDAAYRMTFGGTMTFNADGITGNGTNAFGDTKLKPANVGGGQNNSCFTYYVKNITASNGTDLGAANGTTVLYVNNARNAANVARAYHNSSGAGDTAFTGTSGFFSVSRSVSTQFVASINKTHGTKVVASTTPPDFTNYVMAYNLNGAAANFRARTFGLVTYGWSLTTAQVDSLVDINQKFQTTLGRFA